MDEILPINEGHDNRENAARSFALSLGIAAGNEAAEDIWSTSSSSSSLSLKERFLGTQATCYRLDGPQYGSPNVPRWATIVIF